MKRVLDLSPKVRVRLTDAETAALEAEANRYGARVNCAFSYRSGRWYANAHGHGIVTGGEHPTSPVLAMTRALSEFRHEARKHAIGADPENPWAVAS